ncbi:MAG TPA: NAD(P)/FAD-dependent oxidoreductase [Candidatus Thermoplasmatota archaeon]|nr:NAD(P)/FAD-dependent oxidoreductase [Candidatus Thermoplasmatota archaeon]
MPGLGKPLDVKIVGGGLAGMITAHQLLAHPRPDGRPYQITIYESAEKPYTTLCGEGISDENLRRFAAFDSFPHVAQTFRGAAWYMPGDKVIHVEQKCHTIERATWIPAMAESFRKKGGKLVLNKKILLEDLPHMAYDVLIGADGPGSVVRKYIGGTIDIKLGIQYRVKHSSYATDRLEFYTDKAYCSEYAWIFPKDDTLNVGLLADNPTQDWKRLDRFMKDKGVDGKVAVREAYPIGFNGDKVADPAFPNVALVGDSGGLTNPLTKGGIAAVILSSEILAQCVARDELALYNERIMTHPIMNPAYKKAVAWIAEATNEEIARLIRFLPKVTRSGDGVPKSENRWTLLKTFFGNLDRLQDVRTIYRAMSLSRRYSW